MLEYLPGVKRFSKNSLSRHLSCQREINSFLRSGQNKAALSPCKGRSLRAAVATEAEASGEWNMKK